LDDVALETRFYYDGTSLLRLSVRYNGSAENYTVSVFPDGRMTLARNFAVVVASLPGIALNNWHTLQVSAVGRTFVCWLMVLKLSLTATRSHCRQG
jgi:hypothetical protein